jgi:hypothetical protein
MMPCKGMRKNNRRARVGVNKIGRSHMLPASARLVRLGVGQYPATRRMVMEDPEHCVAQLRDCSNLSAVKRAIQSADEAWTEEFIEHGGLTAILDCLSVLGETAVDSLSDALPRLEVVSCLKAVLNCRYGLECVIRRGGNEGSMVGKIALALNTDNILLKIQIFLVLSAISKHSREGLDATLEALDNYKLTDI